MAPGWSLPESLWTAFGWTTFNSKICCCRMQRLHSGCCRMLLQHQLLRLQHQVMSLHRMPACLVPPQHQRHPQSPLPLPMAATPTSHPQLLTLPLLFTTSPLPHTHTKVICTTQLHFCLPTPQIEHKYQRFDIDKGLPSKIACCEEVPCE